MSCAAGRRYSSGSALLWLWHRLAATASILPLTWEPPYAIGAALKIQKKIKKNFLNKIIPLQETFLYLTSWEIKNHFLRINHKLSHLRYPTTGHNSLPPRPRNVLPWQCLPSGVPGTSSGLPFLGRQPTRAGSDGWCAGDLCSQHGRNAARLGECDEAARQNSCFHVQRLENWKEAGERSFKSSLKNVNLGEAQEWKLYFQELLVTK